MNYIVYLELGGLYLRTLNLQDETAVVYVGERLLDVSYEASRRGVTPRLSLQEAKLILQNQGVYIEYNEADYQAAASQWLLRLLKYSSTIEPSSPSSAFIDLSDHPQPDEIAIVLLTELRGLENLPLVAGISTAKWLAQTAARPCPQGLLELGILPADPVLNPKLWLSTKQIACLTPLSVETCTRLQQLGLQYVSEIQAMSDAALTQQFKKSAMFIRLVTNGLISDPVKAMWPDQSIAITQSLERCESSLELDDALQLLAQKAAFSLNNTDQLAKQLHLYIGFESNKVFESRRILKNAVQTSTHILTHLRQFVQSYLIQEPVTQVRLLMTELHQATRRQTALDILEKRDASLIESTLNRIQNAYGKASVVQASCIQHSREQLVLKAWKEVYGWK